MIKFKTGLSLGVFVLLAAPVLAQQPAENVGRVIVSVPKSGMMKQYEEGRKKHMDWHRKNNDSWAWIVYQVMTGESTGAYLSTTFGHTWKDMDDWDAAHGEADTADANANMGPAIGAQQESIWAFMPRASKVPADSTPAKMEEVLHFLLKPGEEREFNYGIHKITEAINKTNWATHFEWFVLVNGGEGPHYVLVIPLRSWADMKEPEPSFDMMLEKALGKHEAEEVMKSVDRATKRQWSEIIVYRPDLSHIPAKK